MADATASSPDGTIELLVRADDSGKTRDINLAVRRAHLAGIITSTSLMPAGLYFDEALETYRDLPDLALGVHVALICDYPVRPVLPAAEVPSIVGPDGFLYRTLEDLVTAEPQAEELEREIRAQVAKAQATGVRLSYVDYHMATQSAPGATEMMQQVCREERLIFDQVGLCERAHLSPESWRCVRHEDGQVVWVCGPTFTPEQRQGFWTKLAALGPNRWWEPVHPGSREPQSVSIMELLLDPETRRIIDERGIRLISHHDLWAEVYG